MNSANLALALLHLLLWPALALVAVGAWQAAQVDLLLGLGVGLIGAVDVLSIIAMLAFVLTPRG